MKLLAHPDRQRSNCRNEIIGTSLEYCNGGRTYHNIASARPGVKSNTAFNGSHVCLQEPNSFQFTPIVCMGYNDNDTSIIHWHMAVHVDQSMLRRNAHVCATVKTRIVSFSS